jgi:polyhydroxybutyrate depolymerase
MIRPRVFSCLALTLLAVATSGAAQPQPGALREHKLVHDGLTRAYLLYTPRNAGALKGKRPLVFVLHGGGGTHRHMVRSSKGKFHELADRDGFYVVYPNAVDKIWDFGEGEISESLPRRVDDLGFFKALLATLLDRHPLDAERVYATGISRGGQASYFLACKTRSFRAIAPVAMPLPAFLRDDCVEGPPVGLAVLNGTEDPLVPYQGGQIDLFGQDRGQVLSTDETVRLWRERNGCAAHPAERRRIDKLRDGTRIEKSVWSSDCPEAPVTLYRIEGGGHTWPSGTQYLPALLVGRVSREIDGAVVAWGFFSGLD